MKPSYLSVRAPLLVALAAAAVSMILDPQSQGQTVTPGTVTPGSVTGGTVTGGSVTGGSVTGGDVKGGTVTGGSVTGGTVTGGSVTGGTATGGTVTAGTVGPATATATSNGREITARTTGSVSIQSTGDKAVVNLGNHVLVVEKERVSLDGKEQGKIPASAAKIAIDVQNNTLAVRADGTEVLSTELTPKK